MTDLRTSTLILLAFAMVVGCRLGYDEVRSGAEAGAAGEPGDSGGASMGGSGGANSGGSGQGGSAGSIGGAGEGGEAAAGGGPSGGTSGATGTGGAGGESGASSGGTAGGGAGGGGMAGGGGSGGGAGGGSGGGAGAPNTALCNSATYGGHTYLLCKEERNWADANSGCIAAGMRLVRIDDDAENQWLFDNAFTDTGRVSLVWIGATDGAVEGEWRWTDGALFWLGDQTGMAQDGLFAGWYFREPNDVSPGEHCASLESNGSTPAWYDTRCELLTPYICESF